MISDGTINTEGNSSEPPSHANDCCGQQSEGNVFSHLTESPRGEDKVVDHVAEHEHGEPQRR